MRSFRTGPLEIPLRAITYADLRTGERSDGGTSPPQG
ncbi:hypothetical protein [Nesterenkonia sp. F]